MPRHTILSSRLPRGVRRRRFVALAVLTSSAMVATLTAGQPAAATQAAPGSASATDVTMIQANIKSALSVPRFQSDVSKVLASRPDFVTYNEVPLRNDAVMAPAGYALHRGLRNRYTRSTAVAWRTDRWSEVDSGTFRISNYRHKPPGRKIKLGLRYANWVTLRSVEGRQLSVVSVHIAPLDKNMPDLLRGSVKRLRRLTGILAPSGPVLVGGDFNVHYRSGRYPRGILSGAGLVPSYDALGTYFPTGDHRKATIDYVFNRGADQLAAGDHHPIELYSDHDAVVAGFGWAVDAPVETVREVSRPRGDTEERRLAVGAVVDAVRSTEAGESVDVVTSALGLRPITRALLSGMRRGVHVRVVSRGPDVTRAERRVARVAKRLDDPASGFRRCQRACFTAWKESGMAPSLVLLGDADRSPRLRLDLNRKLNRALVERRTAVVTHVGAVALEEGAEQLATLR